MNIIRFLRLVLDYPYKFDFIFLFFLFSFLIFIVYVFFNPHIIFSEIKLVQNQYQKEAEIKSDNSLSEPTKDSVSLVADVSMPNNTPDSSLGYSHSPTDIISTPTLNPTLLSTSTPNPTPNPVNTPTINTPTSSPTRANTPTITNTPSPTPSRVNTPTPIQTITNSPSNPSPTPTSNTANLSKIFWNGRNWNLTGVNMPWYEWGCDFGCVNNRGGGVTKNYNIIANKFNILKSNNVHVVRWWMFPGNPWQIQTDNSGKPISISSSVYEDIDKALKLADSYNIYYIFVLFSAPSHLPQSWLNNTDHLNSLSNVLGNFFRRYINQNRILSWEIINEPEFDVWQNKVKEANVVNFVKSIAKSIKANSKAYVSLGNAMLDGIPMWKNVTEIDFFSPHWYDYMNPGQWCAICVDANEVRKRYGINKPIIIGEYYLGSNINPNQRIEQWYTKGYAGSWAWSLFHEKTSDGMQINISSLAYLSKKYNDIGPK